MEKSARLHLSALWLQIHVDAFLKDVDNMSDDRWWQMAKTALSVGISFFTEGSGPR